MPPDKPDSFAPVAPAIHTDALWGGPRDLENAGPVPVHVETKAEYWALLNARGLQMKDMQESSTGPEREIVTVPVPDPTPVPPPNFTQRDAEIFHAYEAVLKKYGLIETLGCDVCWDANRASGCRTSVDTLGVRVECRCGVREYRGPKGTTDQPAVLNGLTLNDQTTGALYDAHGQPTATKAVIIPQQDATIIRAYLRTLRAYRLSHTLFCGYCCGRRFTDETAIRAKIDEFQVALACGCRIRFSQT